MPPQEQVTKVWIEEGCIVCDACETAAPTVFHVTDDTCIIRPEAHDPAFTKPITGDIIDAAEECPVDVIKFETVTEDVPEGAGGANVAAPAEEAAPTAVPTAAATPAPAAEAPAPAAPAPAPTQTAPAAAPVPAVAASASMAGEGDPAIQALLRAATARGGNAGLLKRSETSPGSIEATRRQDPRSLPPDARMAKVVEAAQKAKADPDAKRRAVVGGGALALGWTAFAAGGGVATVAGFRFAVPNVLEEPDPRIRVGKVQRYVEMQPGEVNEDFKNQGIWMIREDERIAALNIICTHLGCIPNWLPNDRKFKCPCHGSGYRADGVNFEGPTPRPLERFRVFMEEGIVIVDKSKKYQHELGQWDQPGSFVPV